MPDQYKIHKRVFPAVVILLVMFLFFTSCSDEGIKVVDPPGARRAIKSKPSSLAGSATSTTGTPTPAVVSPAPSRPPIPTDTAMLTSSPRPSGSPPYRSIFGDPLTGKELQELSTPAPSPGPTVTVTVTETPTVVVTTVTPSPSPSGPLSVASPAPVDPVTGKRPWIDLVFVVDCTGSMGDELEVIKTKLHQMVRAISSGLPEPYVRYGIVAYRDRGDEFVTLRFDMTNDTNLVYSNISRLYAAGGGDTPESVAEALHVAITEMKWDKGHNSRKLIFLIGDAGPHEDYPGGYDYRKVAREAARNKITIYPVGCSGIERHGLEQFRFLADETKGTYDFLTYRQQFQTMDGRTLWLVSGGRRNIAVMNGPNDDAWKKGYDRMVADGGARPVNVATIRGSMPIGPLENNLDQFLVDKVKTEAQDMGVKYRD